MQEITLQDNSIMNFEFNTEEEQKIHFHQNIELIYVLDGEMRLTIGDEQYDVKTDDVVIINTNKKHLYHSEGEVLIGYFHINLKKLSSILNTNQILFWCNSVIDKNDEYDKLREIAKQIFNQYFEKSEQNNIYLMSLYYQLLNILVSNFLVKNDDKRFLKQKDIDEERVAQIVNYINENYFRSLSLNDLSEKLFLSIPYLSKYIKKKLGSSFIDYVNNIRLFHAVEDLLYTDKSIVYVSFENGFANTTAFSVAFKKAYHMTPSEYRTKKKQNKNNNKIEEKKQEKIIQKVNEFLENNSITKIIENDHLEECVSVDANEGIKYESHWNKMINIGPASDLLRSDMQKHVLLLKNELNFKYVRFWDIYSDELYVNEDNEYGNYNFDKLDKIFDFLIENGLSPYIELGYKPQQLYRTILNPMIIKENEIKFKNYESLQRFMKGFAAHITNRYGIEEIENWYFEQWYDERMDIDSERTHFFELFESIYKIMKEISPAIKVGGAGIGIQYGRGNLLKLLKAWEKRNCYPDFISLYCYPYINGYEDGAKYVKMSTDRNFLKNQLSMAKELIATSKFKDIEIHISEWSLTVSNRNTLNDSCFKGSYIMKSIIDSIKEVNMLGYWLGSDIFSEFYDSQMLLDGGCGLLNKDGIKKPSFYAFDFLNRLGKYLLGVDSNSILTASGHKSYSIACHNYRHLNYKYYLKQEDDISIQKQYQMFEDNKELKLNYQIRNIEDGTYRITIYSVNNEHGSVQDEWKQMEMNNHLTKRDIDYLKQVCIPRIFMKTCIVKDGILNLDTKLMSQEIQFIHIRYLYD